MHFFGNKKKTIVWEIQHFFLEKKKERVTNERIFDFGLMISD